MQWFENIRRAGRHWLLRRLPPCEQLLPVISQRLDRKLPLRERIVLNLHLFACKWCLNYARQLTFLRDTFRAQAKEVDREEISRDVYLSADAKERIKESLRRF
jgi:Putative zinc-finger